MHDYCSWIQLMRLVALKRLHSGQNIGALHVVERSERCEQLWHRLHDGEGGVDPDRPRPAAYHESGGVCWLQLHEHHSHLQRSAAVTQWRSQSRLCGASTTVNGLCERPLCEWSLWTANGICELPWMASVNSLSANGICELPWMVSVNGLSANGLCERHYVNGLYGFSANGFSVSGLHVNCERLFCEWLPCELWTAFLWAASMWTVSMWMAFLRAVCEWPLITTLFTTLFTDLFTDLSLSLFTVLMTTPHHRPHGWSSIFYQDYKNFKIRYQLTLILQLPILKCILLKMVITKYCSSIIVISLSWCYNWLRGRSKLSTFIKAYRGYARGGGGVGDHCTLFSKIDIWC